MSVEEGTNSVLTNTRNQLYATLIANIILLSHGCCVGWLSPSLPILLSEETPLSTGRITNKQIAWLASISSIGSICGTFFCGILSACVGCKRAMIFLAFPPIIFWLFVIFGDTYHHILIGRFFSGISGGGIQAGVTLYVAEISNDNIRGRLGSITPLARNIGVLVAFSVGAFVKYEHTPYIFIILPVIYLVSLLLIPNTPGYHLRNRNFEKADASLQFYKSCNGKSDAEKSYLHAEFERLKTINDEHGKNSEIEISDFYSRMALKAIIISLGVSWFLQTTGCYIVTSFASIIFDKSGTLIGTETSSIILAAMQIFGGLLSTRLADTFGRKTTIFISLAVSAVGLFTFTIYMYLRHNGYDVSNFLWLPVVCLSLIIFISAAGVMALSNTYTVENFPTKIRTAGMVFYSLCNNAVAFIGDKSFPIALETIHLHGFFLFLAVNSCIGLSLLVFVKETRGSALNEISKSDENYSAKAVDEHKRF